MSNLAVEFTKLKLKLMIYKINLCSVTLKII